MSCNMHLDLVDAEPEEWPSHLRVRSFTYPGTKDAVVLWVGSENEGRECEVTLSIPEVDKLVAALLAARFEAAADIAAQLEGTP